MTISVANPSSYIHTPFKVGDNRSIRLLSLQPGNFQDPVQVTLEQVSLDDCPDYEALSYVWGSTPNCSVLCDGAHLLITINCADALRQLRHEGNDRVLWIDGICVDQTSMEERAQQVQLMGDVYSMAKCVLIWLGKETELSDFFMNFLEACHKIRISSGSDETLKESLLESKDQELLGEILYMLPCRY
jgi:hypothetical protein